MGRKKEKRDRGKEDISTITATNVALEQIAGRGESPGGEGG